MFPVLPVRVVCTSADLPGLFFDAEKQRYFPLPRGSTHTGPSPIAPAELQELQRKQQQAPRCKAGPRVAGTRALNLPHILGARELGATPRTPLSLPPPPSPSPLPPPWTSVWVPHSFRRLVVEALATRPTAWRCSGGMQGASALAHAAVSIGHTHNSLPLVEPALLVGNSDSYLSLFVCSPEGSRGNIGSSNATAQRLSQVTAGQGAMELQGQPQIFCAPDPAPPSSSPPSSSSHPQHRQTPMPDHGGGLGCQRDGGRVDEVTVGRKKKGSGVNGAHRGVADTVSGSRNRAAKHHRRSDRRGDENDSVDTGRPATPASVPDSSEAHTSHRPLESGRSSRTSRTAPPCPPASDQPSPTVHRLAPRLASPTNSVYLGSSVTSISTLTSTGGACAVRGVGEHRLTRESAEDGGDACEALKEFHVEEGLLEAAIVTTMGTVLEEAKAFVVRMQYPAHSASRHPPGTVGEVDSSLSALEGASGTSHRRSLTRGGGEGPGRTTAVAGASVLRQQGGSTSTGPSTGPVLHPKWLVEERFSSRGSIWASACSSVSKSASLGLSNGVALLDLQADAHRRLCHSSSAVLAQDMSPCGTLVFSGFRNGCISTLDTRCPPPSSRSSVLAEAVGRHGLEREAEVEGTWDDDEDEDEEEMVAYGGGGRRRKGKWETRQATQGARGNSIDRHTREGAVRERGAGGGGGQGRGVAGGKQRHGLSQGGRGTHTSSRKQQKQQHGLHQPLRSASLGGVGVKGGSSASGNSSSGAAWRGRRRGGGDGDATVCSHASVVHMTSAVCSLRAQRSDDRYIIAAAMDGSLCRWDRRNVHAPVTVYGGHVNTHSRLPILVDSSDTLLLAGGEDCIVRLWSVASGRLLSSCGPLPSPPLASPSVCFSGEGALFGAVVGCDADLFYIQF